MLESYPLITAIVISVVAAFLLGMLANRLRLPTILGYLLAGALLGPNTPGFIADINIAEQLAEIGVILLMFGVGLHFSVKDLVRVQRIALPGAVIQMSLTSAFCLMVAMLLGHGFAESLVFGITLSVASTVVLLRALEQYKLSDSAVGKVAVGWLIVEDIAMVVVLVLLPVFADMSSKGEALNSHIIFEAIFLVLLKISAFVMVMMVFGRRILPKLLVVIAKTKSRELMSLGILAIASGFAFVAYTLFGTSFALGAFMAGFVLNGSEIGKKSADKSLPLRDIFSVLFFVSAGMLFNPSVITKEPLLIMTAVLLVVVGKSIISFFIMRLFRQGFYNALILAVSLAQIGEFSFILAAISLKLTIFSQIIYDMVIASAIISITINPFLFKWAKRFKPQVQNQN
ncbi:MAG: cation:proton antiporter [Rickettsiales bacterium]|nr:cation:proton antiporter [Rickettsiales bacterium]